MHVMSIVVEGIHLGSIQVDEKVPGRFACPVCGHIIHSDCLPAAAFDDPGLSVAFSYDICDCCRTQYGADEDFEFVAGGLDLAWANLRQRWLSTLPDAAIASQQLKNIGIGLNPPAPPDSSA